MWPVLPLKAMQLLWAVLQAELMLMSEGHAVGSHTNLSGLCSHLKPCWYLNWHRGPFQGLWSYCSQDQGLLFLMSTKVRPGEVT